MTRVILRQPPLRRIDRPLVAFVRDSRDAFACEVVARSISGTAEPVRRASAMPGLRTGFPAGTARCLALGLLCGSRGREICEGPVATLQWPEESTLLLDPCVRSSLLPLRFSEDFIPGDMALEDCVYFRGSNLLYRQGCLATVLAVMDANSDRVGCCGAAALALALGARPVAVSEALSAVAHVAAVVRADMEMPA